MGSGAYDAVTIGVNFVNLYSPLLNAKETKDEGSIEDERVEPARLAMKWHFAKLEVWPHGAKDASEGKALGYKMDFLHLEYLEKLRRWLKENP